MARVRLRRTRPARSSSRGRTTARCRASSGSLVEEELKAGRLPAVVATSSLELGIDMGAVDLVVQVEAPPSVASGLQRVGRAGHQVGAVSRRRCSRSTAAISSSAPWSPSGCATARSSRCATRATRSTCWPSRSSRWSRWTPAPSTRSTTLVRRAAPFAGLPRSALEAVLDMLAGRYPSDAFAELRPRLVWDRVTGELTARRGAQRLAVTSGGTIPDRGLFGVFLAGGDGPGPAGRRARRGDGLRVAGRRRVPARLVVLADRGHHPRPGAGHPGARASSAGCRSGRATRPAARSSWAGRSARSCARSAARRAEAARGARSSAPGWTSGAPANLLAYLAEQRAATGTLPDDRTIAGRAVPRRARRLAAGRALAVRRAGATRRGRWRSRARLRERYGIDVTSMHSDDGIVLRLPDTDGEPPPARPRACSSPTRSRRWSPPRSAARRCSRRASASAPRGRCCCPAATRAAAPRCGSSASAPTSCSRWRAEYADFPIVLEAMRECLQDVFDVPGLVGADARPRGPQVRARRGRDAAASPFAAVAAVRLRRHVPLRGRRAAGRAAGAGALARLRAARRAARRGRAARAARRRRDRRGRARDRPAGPGPARARRGRACTTCCGRSAT